MHQVQKLTTGALFVAFGVFLPLVFHFTGLSGAVFLPMHIPVLIAGLLLGGKAGFAVGILTPFISSMLTGMPPIMPTLPRMAVELSVYGLTVGYFYQSRNFSLLLSLLGAMLLGRVASLVTIYILVVVLDLGINPLIYVKAATVHAFPGIIAQLFLIPLIIKKLESTFELQKI